MAPAAFASSQSSLSNGPPSCRRLRPFRSLTPTSRLLERGNSSAQHWGEFLFAFVLSLCFGVPFVLWHVHVIELGAVFLELCAFLLAIVFAPGPREDDNSNAQFSRARSGSLASPWLCRQQAMARCIAVASMPVTAKAASLLCSRLLLLCPSRMFMCS